ncbi:MAG TPA: hypothetical protein VMI75_30440, partial [Polyangiaceae bacterium]|nr:hypothetical protein [Polyangiaceae bacterium]
DAAGTFNERFAFKPTGALAVNGSTGTAGQVLQTNGASSAATWVSPTSTQNANITIIDSSHTLGLTDHMGADLPDLTKTVTLTGAAKAIVSVSVYVSDPGCVACGASFVSAYLDLDNVDVRVYGKYVANGGVDWITFTDGVALASGTHTIKVKGYTISGSKTVTFGDFSPVSGNSMTVQIIPQ